MIAFDRTIRSYFHDLGSSFENSAKLVYFCRFASFSFVIQGITNQYIHAFCMTNDKGVQIYGQLYQAIF